MAPSPRVAPSGDQYEIEAAGYRAVVTESGGALRVLEHGGRPLVDGFGEDEVSSGGRGQLLMPWPNRIRDGRYSFGGSEHQLALTEPKRSNASHGLARWAAWTLEEHTANSVSLVLRVMAQSGYPWAVDLHVLYDLGADGLTVTQTATNLSGEPAPYACGAHPYLCVGHGIDHLELTLPAGTRVLTDDRLLPVETVPVDDEHDFRTARAIGTHRLRRDVRRPVAHRRRRHGDAARPRVRQRRRPVGRRADPVAAALQRRRRPGCRAALAGGRADDGPAGRVQLRDRPRHPGAVRGAGRRAVGDVGHPGADPGRRTRLSGQRSISARTPRTAAWARSPSEPWIASTDMVVPSARSSDAHGAPCGSRIATPAPSRRRGAGSR